MSSACKVAIVMGKSDVSAPRHKQQSMILVPMDSPGLTVERPLSVYGFEHPPLGHAELTFRGVRVPKENILLGEGRGFEIAQSRLGPGRIHHCMRFIGLAERAIKAMCRRAKARAPSAERWRSKEPCGRRSDSRAVISSRRRLVTLEGRLEHGSSSSKAARNEIAIAKIVVPTTVGRILDRAIQIHGGAGTLAGFLSREAFAETRFLRIGDGPERSASRSAGEGRAREIRVRTARRA